MKPILKWATVYLLVGVLLSCSSTLRVPPSGTLNGYLIEGVPLYTQKRLQCGPSALATVLAYYGIDADPDDIARTMAVERLGGALAIDLLLYAKKKGLGAKFYKGSLEDLKKNIRANSPPIIFVDFGMAGIHIGHFMVATGYDDAKGGVIVHSGKSTPEFITYKRLEKIWKKTGFATLLIRPER